MDNISREVHPTAQVEAIYGTVGEFVTYSLLKMDAESISLVNFTSTTESKFGVFPTTEGGVYCCLFATYKLLLRPKGG